VYGTGVRPLGLSLDQQHEESLSRMLLLIPVHKSLYYSILRYQRTILDTKLTYKCMH
jgi:hypothetical protein